MASWLSFIFGNRKKVNRRRNLRYQVAFKVRLNSESVSNAGAEMVNLSFEGCYIRMSIAVEKGEKMQINVSLPIVNTLTVNGIVAFCDPGEGFGIEFDLTHGQKEFMIDLIEFVRGDD